MKGWKIFCTLLILGYLVLAGFKINDKIDEKNEVSSYINSINKWNEKQAALQKRYSEEVVDQKKPKEALSALSNILKENDKLIAETEKFQTNSYELKLALAQYQEGLSSISDAYRSFYHAMLTNEDSILKDGELSLKQAEDKFKEHEVTLNKVAKKNFIQLQ